MCARHRPSMAGVPCLRSQIPHDRRHLPRPSRNLPSLELRQQPRHAAQPVAADRHRVPALPGQADRRGHHRTDAERAAPVFYGVCLFVTAALLAGLWRLITRRRELIGPEITEAQIGAYLQTSRKPRVLCSGDRSDDLLVRVAAFSYLVQEEASGSRPATTRRWPRTSTRLRTCRLSLPRRAGRVALDAASDRHFSFGATSPERAEVEASPLRRRTRSLAGRWWRSQSSSVR
jgi:hypothetical protein